MCVYILFVVQYHRRNVSRPCKWLLQYSFNYTYIIVTLSKYEMAVHAEWAFSKRCSDVNHADSGIFAVLHHLYFTNCIASQPVHVYPTRRSCARVGACSHVRAFVLVGHQSLAVYLCVSVSVCPRTCRHIALRVMNGCLCMSGTILPTMCQMLVVTQWPN